MKYLNTFPSLKLTAIAVLVFSFSACDDLFTVENPGPIQEESLDSRDAVPGLVTGMSADFSFAFRQATWWGGVWSDDMTHSGTLGAPTVFSGGVLDTEDVDPWWGNAQRARWVAENGLERMEDVMEDEFEFSDYTSRAYLLAGYSNRMLGENSCNAVFDGGQAEDFTEFFNRAYNHFSNAHEVADNIDNDEKRYAALAGNASVEAALGNWSSAAAYAEQVPADFVYEAVFSQNTSRENNNWPQYTIDRGEYSVYGSPYEEVDDPRAPQEPDLDGDGEIRSGADGSTPWIKQMKHDSEGSNIAVSKGTEMLLIRAEYQLREHEDHAEALSFINQVRDYHGLDDAEAENLEEAWDLLQVERGLELWLEGRRFWDLRRWNNEDGPAHHDFLTDRDDCVPIGRGELDSNPNL